MTEIEGNKMKCQLLSTILPSYWIKIRIITLRWIWQCKWNSGIRMLWSFSGQEQMDKSVTLTTSPPDYLLHLQAIQSSIESLLKPSLLTKHYFFFLIHWLEVWDMKSKAFSVFRFKYRKMGLFCNFFHGLNIPWPVEA